jgi:hypothetical protein
MRCAKCGAEVKPSDTCCPNCALVSSKVEVIEDVPGHEDRIKVEEGPGYYQYQSTGPQRRVYVKHVNFAHMGFLPKLIGALVLLFIFFIALPLAVLLFLGFTVFWFFFRRR